MADLDVRSKRISVDVRPERDVLLVGRRGGSGSRQRTIGVFPGWRFGLVSCWDVLHVEGDPGREEALQVLLNPNGCIAPFFVISSTFVAAWRRGGCVSFTWPSFVATRLPSTFRWTHLLTCTTPTASLPCARQDVATPFRKRMFRPVMQRRAFASSSSSFRRRGSWSRKALLLSHPTNRKETRLSFLSHWKTNPLSIGKGLPFELQSKLA